MASLWPSRITFLRGLSTQWVSSYLNSTKRPCYTRHSYSIGVCIEYKDKKGCKKWRNTQYSDTDTVLVWLLSIRLNCGVCNVSNNNMTKYFRHQMAIKWITENQTEQNTEFNWQELSTKIYQYHNSASYYLAYTVCLYHKKDINAHCNGKQPKSSLNLVLGVSRFSNVRQWNCVNHISRHRQVFIPQMVVFVNHLFLAQFHKVILLGFTNWQWACVLALQFDGICVWCWLQVELWLLSFLLTLFHTSQSASWTGRFGPVRWQIDNSVLVRPPICLWPNVAAKLWLGW